MSRCSALIALMMSATVATSPAQGQAPVSPVCRSTPGDTVAAARAYDELSEEQQRVFDGGGQVFVRRDVAGLPWPAVDVYQYIDARPEQAAAVFVDYGLHRTYIPGVRESRVSAIVDRSTVEVDYVVSVPIVSDERYTVRNHLCSYHGGASYGVDWTLVRASSTKATIGHVRFEQHVDTRLGKRGTAMAYSNFVTPGSRLAHFGVVKTRATQQMRETAWAIVRRVEAEQATDRALLEKQIAALRAALEP